MMVTHASYDFDHWTQAAHLSFRRDNIPPRPPTDFEVHQGEQVHVGASLWNRGNVVIGIYGQYHNQTNDRRFAMVDLGLVVSHDAVHFREPIPDFKMIPYAEEPDDAEPRLLQGQGFQNIGDRTFFWYSVWPAWNLIRGSDDVQSYGPNGVRMATWPRDRLGYFSPGPDEQNAHCISSPITTQGPGQRVLINADGLSEPSRLRVEVLNERFEPMPGYSGQDCIPVVRSGLRQPVMWRGRQRLEGIDHPIRIRVRWEGPDHEDARLFAVYVGDSD